jgi:NADH:ubiquinone oxidoreductase subunit C
MFEKEESIVKSLTEKFGFFEGNCTVTRARRIFAQAPREKIVAVADYVKNTLKFGSLCTITGLDLGEDFQLIYHLANEDGIVLNIKVNAPKSDPVIETVTESYNGGILYEEEIRNLLGVDITGIPTDIRYPLPDGWPDGQHPLRKDWKGEMPEIKQEGEC